MTSQELLTINALSQNRPTIHVKAGDVIFSPGDFGDQLYGIVSGTVEITWGSVLRETIGPGSCFGVGALVDGEHRRYGTATASTDCELLEMDRPEFLFAMQELPLFGLEMLHDLELRLQQLKQAVANG
ncbi:cyclic nucleotide-binding domain-containing protein [Synechococcus sp. FGCU-3]|jgi:CRP/FNR family transcriptional regulator, cyclic AMP receptor protein|nr:cyclic nucleotide-binding domain-containing protein [Synechococcus sp. FGCU3]